MGEAIVGGLVAARAFAPGMMTVVEPDQSRREFLASTHGVRVASDPSQAVAEAAIVLLAVKPQVMDDVVRALASDVAPGTLVVSIAAGLTTERLEALLPAGTPVVRVMPNTPALVREGMAVVSAGSTASPEDTEAVLEMFASLGRAVVLDERFQDAATAISGSGPAYVAMFVEALADAADREGLDRDLARQLAVQTLRGTAELLEITGMTPEELVRTVSSPGGTTMAATAAMDEGGFGDSIRRGVAAAVARAKELGAR